MLQGYYNFTFTMTKSVSSTVAYSRVRRWTARWMRLPEEGAMVESVTPLGGLNDVSCPPAALVNVGRALMYPPCIAAAISVDDYQHK